MESLPEHEADALHSWCHQFRSAPRATFAPWYIEGCIPADATDVERDELTRAVFAILRELTAPDGFLHYADLQHEYARFYPNRVDSLAFDELFVEGEDGGHIAPDRSWGVVSAGYTVLVQVRFFGEPLVSRLRARNPALLAKLLPIASGDG